MARLTWLGAAGFRIETGGRNWLIDPYLTRNRAARPVQPLGPDDLDPAEGIFLSHGHFDHALDIPALANRLGAPVHCHQSVADNLVSLGLNPNLVRAVERDGQGFDLGPVRATAHYSRHVAFDRALVIRTLIRANLRIPAGLKLLRRFPAGQVLSWRFQGPEGIIHHFGSAGSQPDELDCLARLDHDLLLLPLQGHTRICDIALNYVRVLKPKLVIPHHQDDFYPPVSQQVDIAPFMAGVKAACPRTEALEMRFNRPIEV